MSSANSLFVVTVVFSLAALIGFVAYVITWCMRHLLPLFLRENMNLVAFIVFCALFFVVYKIVNVLLAILATGAFILFYKNMEPLEIDKIFAWMYRGQHYGNRAIKRNQKEAAMEFGRLMRQQNFDDVRMATLFQNMSETKRRMWKARYQERAEQARRLREIVEEQRKAMEADTQLGKDVEEREILRAMAERMRRR